MDRFAALMQTPVCYILFPVCSLARVYQIRDWMIGSDNIKMQMQMFEAFQVSALCPVSISSYELQIFSVSRNINGLLMTEFKKWRAPKAAGRTAAPRRDRAPKTTWRPWGTWTTTRGRSSATARSICWEPPSRPRACGVRTGARGRNRPRPSNLSSPYFTQGMMACDALWSLNNIKYVW